MHTSTEPLLVADIGGSQIRLAHYGGGRDCRLLERRSTPGEHWSEFSTALLDAFHCAEQQLGRPASALAISIAGVVVPESGEVIAARLPGLAGRSLAGSLQALLQRPVAVHNDADCAALAEARLGAAQGERVVFGAVLGTGVGGGLVVDGRLVIGAGGLCGEWGHGPFLSEALVRAGDGRKVRLPRWDCGCGQSGCLDTLGGARGLERLHALLHPRADGSRADSWQILAAWQAGEPEAQATLAVYLDRVAAGLALVVNTTGASAVPLSGGLAQCTALVEALDQAVRQRILRRSSAPLLRQAQLGEEAGLIGAALALQGAA